MFSGIKSMLFGYSDPDAEPKTNEECTNNSKDAAERSAETSTSSFEQTLNAATTKLTEQLLPQSASIEELLSSSHQILPSFNEQLEQEISFRAAANEVGNGRSCIENDASEDDCIDADSWELLDLVEKPGLDTSGLELTVQTKEEAVTERSSNGGILKQGVHKKVKDDRTGSCKNQRLKPKVSFDTSDLVGRQSAEKIESTTGKNNSDFEAKGSTNDGIKASTKSKKLKKASGKTLLLTEEKKSPAVEVAAGGNKVGEYVHTDDSAFGPTKTRMQPVVPKLNYAAALAAKPNKLAVASEQSPVKALASCSVEDDRSVVAQAGTAVKRNRPISISSCSSSDEIETVEVDEQQIAKVITSNVVPNTGDKDRNVFDIVDDDESVISSGFSDCDYGYGGMSDYIMRPKKNQRRRTTSTSSSKFIASSACRNGSTKSQACSSTKSSLNTAKSNPPKPLTYTTAMQSSKHMKPKKKKLVVQQSTDRKQPSFADVERKRRASEGKSCEGNNQLSCDFLKRKTGENVASNNCSNESSDIAEMDESWYVTPPPCFTGVKAKSQLDASHGQIASVVAKEAEAERENSLIEHPSIYIAGTSKQILIEKALTDEAPQQITSKKIVLKRKHKISETKSEVTNESKQQSIRKVASTKLIVSASPSKSSTKLSQKVSQKPASKPMTPVLVNQSQKAWENKFVVTSWDDDEQVDFDFDNVHDYGHETRCPTPKCSGSKLKSSKRQLKNIVKKEVQPSTSEDSSESDDMVSVSSPALAGLTCYEESPIEPGQKENVGVENKEPVDDIDSSSIGKIARELVVRKPPTAVKPIEPERRPGWQLRRMRSKRHPLGSLIASSNSVAAPANAKPQQSSHTDDHLEPIVSSKSKGSRKGGRNRLVSQRVSDSDGTEAESASSSSCLSASSSARSSPTLMDRIGSSIVANLSNLTSGLVASTALPARYTLPGGARSDLVGGVHTATSPTGATPTGAQAVAAASIGTGSGGRALVSAMAKSAARGLERSLIVERKRMSKASLRRANKCASYESHRCDRRARMSRVPNGCSVDRKVHTSFH